MNTDYFKGIIPPIVTPIDENENVNEKALRKLIDYEIDGGVSGILAFGSNGEFYRHVRKEVSDIVSEDAGIVRVKGIKPKYWKFDEYNFQRMDEQDELFRLLCSFDDVDFDRFFSY